MTVAVLETKGDDDTSLTWDSAPAPGELLVALRGKRDAPSSPEVPGATYGPWTELDQARYDSGTSHATTAAAYRVAESDGTGIFWGSSSDRTVIGAVRFAPGAAVVGTYTYTGSVGAQNMTISGIDADAGSVIVAMVRIHNFDTPPPYPALTPPAGATEIIGARGEGSLDYGSIVYLEVDADGTYSLTWQSANGSPPAGWFYTMVAVVVSGPAAPIAPKITFSVNAVEFTGLLEKRIRVELNGCGDGHFVISRGDAQATEANLARGNLVQVTVPEIDPDPIFEFFIEDGDFALISSDEEGGEELSFGGPGTLAYLRRAVLAPEEYEDGIGTVKPKKGLWVFEESNTEGHIVNKMIKEAQSASRPDDPIPDLTKNFTAFLDSNGDSWGDETLEGKWRAPIGGNLYDEVMRLVAAGLLQVEMAPGLVLNLYREAGVDRHSATFSAGKVRFVKGVNIADELSRGMAGREFASHAFVRYDDGDYTHTAKNGTFPYVQEIYVEASTDHANTARRVAKGQMGWREDAQEALVFAHLVPWPGAGPDEDAGIYLPGQAWTENGKYWVGDLVTLHTGSEDFDFDNATKRVYAITLYEDQTGYLAPPIVELNAPVGGSGARSLSPVPSIASSTGGSGSSSGGGSSGGSSPSLAGYQAIVEKDAAEGYAGLDGDGLVPVAELPNIEDLATAEMDDSLVLAPDGAGGVEFVAAPSGSVPDGTDPGDILVWDGDSWEVLPVGADDEVLTADAGEALGTKWAAAGGSGGGNVSGQTGDSIEILGLSASPDRTPASPAAADDEFETTDTSDPITGWTTMGALTALNTNSDALSHLHLAAAAGAGGALKGVYKAWSPSNGAKVTCKISDLNMGWQYNRAFLFIAEASPGKIRDIFLHTNSALTPREHIGIDYWTSPTAFSAGMSNGADGGTYPPTYLRIIYNSSTSITYQFSYNGLAWNTVLAAHNPAFTVGAIGLGVRSDNATYGADAYFDWIRFS